MAAAAFKPASGVDARVKLWEIPIEECNKELKNLTYKLEALAIKLSRGMSDLSKKEAIAGLKKPISSKYSHGVPLALEIIEELTECLKPLFELGQKDQLNKFFNEHSFEVFVYDSTRGSSNPLDMGYYIKERARVVLDVYKRAATHGFFEAPEERLNEFNGLLCDVVVKALSISGLVLGIFPDEEELRRSPDYAQLLKSGIPEAKTQCRHLRSTITSNLECLWVLTHPAEDEDFWISERDEKVPAARRDPSSEIFKSSTACRTDHVVRAAAATGEDMSTGGGASASAAATLVVAPVEDAPYLAHEDTPAAAGAGAGAAVHADAVRPAKKDNSRLLAAAALLDYFTPVTFTNPPADGQIVIRGSFDDRGWEEGYPVMRSESGTLEGDVMAAFDQIRRDFAVEEFEFKFVHISKEGRVTWSRENTRGESNLSSKDLETGEVLQFTF